MVALSNDPTEQAKQSSVLCDRVRGLLASQSGFTRNTTNHSNRVVSVKTSQELRMLSNVTLNCQVTKIVMNSGSQLSEL